MSTGWTNRRWTSGPVAHLGLAWGAALVSLASANTLRTTAAAIGQEVLKARLSNAALLNAATAFL
jgi:hypothetical protein